MRVSVLCGERKRLQHLLNALNPECRLMFILTSLWEVAVALLHSGTSWCSAHHTMERLSQVVLNLQNLGLGALNAHFPPAGVSRDVFVAVSLRKSHGFARRNFWIAYKGARSPGFFCLVWRRWFATGLPSPFPFSPAYVITSSCRPLRLWELSYSSPTSLAQPKMHLVDWI